MAARWNRVIVPFPGAASTVRVRFSPDTADSVKSLLRECEPALRLLRSELLQTEVRVLYELLHILKNSFRTNKTFKALQQVEQCVNRLKLMKLEGALQELTDLCPNKATRELCLKTEECSLPSQPALEWLGLKVLGSLQLLSCSMQRCSKAFLLSKQHLTCEEFVILNLVITSLLSRLWVVFRGLLSCLAALYLHLLELHRDVSRARPMPYLSPDSLPSDLAELLGPSYPLLLKRPDAGEQAAKSRVKNVSLADRSFRPQRRVREDLGVAVERGQDVCTDSPLECSMFKKPVQVDPPTQTSDLPLHNDLTDAATFTHLSAQLRGMIQRSKSQRAQEEEKKKTRLLTFLFVRCRRMQCLEEQGYNVQKKLLRVRQEVCRAAAPSGSTSEEWVEMRRTPSGRRRFCSLRKRFRSAAARRNLQRMRTRRRRRGKQRLKTEERRDEQQLTTPDSDEQEGEDDIDDIFASAGL